jgi:hypothetical protein
MIDGNLEPRAVRATLHSVNAVTSQFGKKKGGGGFVWIVGVILINNGDLGKLNISEGRGSCMC